MALTEQVVLDIQSAQRQIDALERQLDQLSTPINVPVNVTGANEVAGVRRDFDQTDDAVERLNRELDDTERSLRQVGTAADRGTQGVLRLGTRGASVFTNLRGSVIGLVTAFGAIQGARAFLDFAGDAIDAASSLEESTSKVGVVFGAFADDIESFASTAPQALGLANREALEFAGTFGNLFVALGLTQGAAADLAPAIVTLGADLASFNNIETTEALDKLRAGLVGEAEPLRALGVNLTAATVEAKGLELGLGGLTGELSEAEKVQARYALIVEQTATAQGDFARTSDSIANRQRTLSAAFDDARVAIGEALLPAFEGLIGLVPDLVSAIESLTPALASAAASFGTFTTEGAGFVTFLADLPRGFGALTDVAGGVGNLVTAPIQGLFDLATTGDVTALFDQVIDGFEGMGRAADNVNIRILEQDVIDALRGGIAPIDAFAAAIKRLQDAGQLDPTTIGRFALITGASTQDQIRVLSLFRTGLELTDIELAAVTTGLREATGAADGLAPPLNELVGGVSQLSPGLASIGPAAAGATPALSEVQQAIDQIAAEEAVSGLAALNAQFAQLPDGLDAAAAALRDDENEIVTDFTQFLDDLEGEIAARQAFREDIALLEALGLDNLAEVFREAGLEAAPALEDGLANIGELRDAEAALDEEAERLATSMVDEFARDIASEPITAALIQEIKDAAAAADNEDVRAALEALAAALTLEIPVTFGDIPVTPGTIEARDRGFPIDINAPPGEPNIDIDMHFEGFVPNTPDLTRAAQAVNQVTQR